MGGEKQKRNAATMSTGGSPPRGRGKGSSTTVLNSGTGITPAWAGKSVSFITRIAPKKDHPRVGGEKAFVMLPMLVATGSPPRGRGKDLPSAPKTSSLGITPSWAGKSGILCLLALRRWDHPRVGGEKNFQRSAALTSPGSPPRGRGKVPGTWSSSYVSGITPAWAGKSQRSRNRQRNT